MLVDPSLEELLTKTDSKFSIVSIVVDRVKQLNDGWTPLVPVVNQKHVTTVLNEIAKDKIVMKRKSGQ